MQVMILDEDPALRTRIAAALAPQGFDILSLGRIATAKEAARRDIIDVLILGELVEGRLAHDVALLAEWRNPGLGAILLSDRPSEDLDELFELLPCLQAVLGRRTDARTLVQVALSAAHAQKPSAEHAESWDDEDAPAGAPVEAGASAGVDPQGPPQVVSPVDTPVQPAPGAAPPMALPTAATASAIAPASSQPIAAALPKSAPSEPIPNDAASPDTPASTVLSVAETRRLLSELAQRYAKMTEEQPSLQLAPPPSPRPVPQVTPRPVEAAFPPAERPAPASQTAYEAMPVRAAAGGRRLHLA